MIIVILAGVITFVFTTLLTIAGVGAAFILIPVFLALGIEVHTAMAIALLLNALAMAVASVNFIRKKLVVWSLVIPMSLVAALISPIGVWVSKGLDRTVLLWIFCGFLLFAALMMLFYKPKTQQKIANKKLLLSVGISVGGVAGFIGGLLGVGGGNIVVPSLVTLGFDPKKASASTSFVVIFASLSGFLSHMAMAGISISLLSATALGSFFGALLGSWLMTDKLQGRQVKLMIGVILLIITAKMVWDLLT